MFFEGHPGDGDQGGRIDNLELVVGQADDPLFAEDLQRPANVNVGEPERLTDVPLAQRQLYGFTRRRRKLAAESDIKLEQQMGDAFTGAAQTKVGQMIVRAKLAGGHLTPEQHGETRIALDYLV